MKDLWNGVADVEIADQPAVLCEGFIGTCEIEKVYVKETYYGPYFFCEMRVLETNLTDVHPAGQGVVWKQALNNRDIAMNAIFDWASAALGVYDNDHFSRQQLRSQLSQLMESALASPESNAFHSKKVRVATHKILTRSARFFTVYKFGVSA